MASKTTYARQGQALSASLLNLADDIFAWRNTYFDRGYGPEGTDPIVDNDVAILDITGTEIVGLAIAAEALETYMAANRAYLSRMRNDI